MDPILRLNEFFVEGGKQSQSHVLLHITEPSTPEEAKKGYFFALAEVNNAETVYITRLQELIDRAENEYYELEEEPGKNNFETVLEKMNEEAFSLEKATGELHCIVGVIKDPDITFSYFGKPHLLLFYRTKTGAYQRMDLIENNQAEVGAPEENQLFSQIIQGKMTPHDFLFAGTPHIIDFFSYDRLEKIITARPALQSAQHLERVLGEIKNGFSFGGLIINLHIPDATEAEQKKIKPVFKKESAESSLHNLFSRETNTANTLSPSLFPKLQRPGTNAPSASPAPVHTPARPQAQINSNHISTRPGRATARETSDRALRFTRAIGSALVLVGKFIAGIFYFLYSLVYNFFRLFFLLLFVIFNYQKRRKTILDDWRRTLHSYRENFRNVSILTKIMLFASIILALGFAGSIWYIHHRQTLAEAEQSFNRTVALIREKKDSAEGNLVYQNQNKALADYQAAEEALASLSCTSKEHQVICTQLVNDFKLLATRLRKVTTVSPTLLTDAKDLVPTVPDMRLIRVNTKIFGYSASTSTLIIFDTDTNNARLLPTYTSISGFTNAATPKENDYILFVFNKNQLMQLNPADMTTKLIDISFPLGKASIDGLVVYNRRLYTVDATNNDLYRHDTIKTGFGQGKEWLKDKLTNLTDARDLAIDGDLFVSKDNGTIAKLTSGQTQSFAISGLDPAFTSAPELWTYNDTVYLYAFDAKNNRIVVLTKDGSLTAQLESPLFKKTSGFAVDAQNKTLYALDNGKLYKFTWPQ